MQRIALPQIGTVVAWRTAARRLAAAGVPSEDVVWQVGEVEGDLFADAPALSNSSPVSLALPRSAISSIETALCHKDPQRFARAYGIVLRLAAGSLRWGDRSDPALHRLLAQEKAVRRDIHKMHAFVRFREIGDPHAPRRAFAAWFEPDHFITEAAAPFFARRFGDMDWIIATPSLTAHFADRELLFTITDGDSRPPADENEELWRTYFTHIFNPARLMVSAMTSEMPKKYWKNLPEAALIPDLIRTAPARARAMQAAQPTLPPERALRILGRNKPAVQSTPMDLSIETLKPALDACRRCPLGACATQAVAGEGPGDAQLMIVGEQPGDFEDLAGRPFIGPAGKVFDHCAQVAGIDRRKVYVTNAVKHFKFRPQGKRRLHQRPNAGEIDHCKWWLDHERRLISPRLIVMMGATAACAVTGDGTAIAARRGKIEVAQDGTAVLATWHPSYVLRLPTESARKEAQQQLEDDLALAQRFVSDGGAGTDPT